MKGVISSLFSLQLAYEIDKDADEQNSYLDGMVCSPVRIRDQSWL